MQFYYFLKLHIVKSNGRTYTLQQQESRTGMLICCWCCCSCCFYHKVVLSKYLTICIWRFLHVCSSNLTSLFSFSCFYSWWVLLPFIHKWQWRVNFYKVFQNMRRAQSMSHLRSSEWTDKWKGSTGLDWTSRAKPTVDGNSFPLSRARTIGFAKTTLSGIRAQKSIEYLNL